MCNIITSLEMERYLKRCLRKWLKPFIYVYDKYFAFSYKFDEVNFTMS